MAVSGDTAVVGAELEDAGGGDAGAAYVFQEPLSTPTPTNPPTPCPGDTVPVDGGCGTPTPTATKQPEPGDTDHDGCSDVQENGTIPNQGGLRSYKDFWDVFDTDTENGLNAGTALTGTVTIGDIFAVAGHFGDTGDSGIDPLSDASGPGYHTRFDRGDQVGDNSWNRAPADGAVAITDIFAVAAQFGLNCS